MAKVKVKVEIDFNPKRNDNYRHVAHVADRRSPCFGLCGLSRESEENAMYDLRFEYFRATGQIVDLYV